MPLMIVTGAEPGTPVRSVLDANLHPEQVVYTDDPFVISDTLADSPDAVLAYAPGSFAALCTGRGVQFERAKRRVVLCFAWQPDPDAGADMTQQAAVVANSKHVLDLNYPQALAYLERMLTEV